MMKKVLPVACLMALGSMAKVLFEDKCRVHGGLWACSDCDKCTSIDDCTYDDAIWRSGYYCKDWPYFNRLAPAPSVLFLPVESKQIRCVEPFQSGCKLWEEKKESGEELAVTACTCTNDNYITASNSDYCQAWTCEGVGVTKCPQGNQANCGAFIPVGLDSGYFSQCCYEECDEDDNCHDVVENKEVHNEYQDCVCIETEVDTNVTDGSTTYCKEWECIDYSRASRNSGGFGYYEFEQHICNERASLGFCQVWDWQTDDYYSWENTGCDCISSSTNTTTGLASCLEYQCKEKGATKTFPELGWIGFGGGFSLIWIALLHNEENFCGTEEAGVLFVGLVLLLATVLMVPALTGGLPALCGSAILFCVLLTIALLASSDGQKKNFHRRMRRVSKYLLCGGCEGTCPYNDEYDKEPVVVPEEVEIPPVQFKTIESYSPAAYPAAYPPSSAPTSEQQYSSYTSAEPPPSYEVVSQDNTRI